MFCTKCGNQIKDGFKFCPKCGTPAYVEKEEPKAEVKNVEVDEVAKETNSLSAVSEPVVKSTEKVKKTAKANTASKPKNKETDTTNGNYIPNPFMARELDIEGLKKRAEEGDRYAMLLQCARYELGIGTEIDMEKLNELKKILGGFSTGWISLFYYSKELATPYILTKNQ